MIQANPLEEAYLKYILIAVDARDVSAPFRTFFDNWFAFKNGGPFLNANSRPHWFNNPRPDRHGEALRRAHFVSGGAARTLAALMSERLVKDHAIPVSVLRDILIEDRPSSTKQVRALLLRYYRFGIITDEEDRRLTAAGLRSRMPNGWTVQDDAFARYRQAGLVGQDLRRSGHAVWRADTLPIATQVRAYLGKMLTSAALPNGSQNG